MKQKSENKKAMPKFFVIVAASLVFGALLGAALVFLKGDWILHTEQAIASLLNTAAPYLLLLCVFLSGSLQYILFRKSKRMYVQWQEEDEETLSVIERQLSIAIQVNSIFCILSFLFVSIPMCHADAFDVVPFFISLGAFLLNLIVMLIGNQKLVDFTKQLHPEKQGSVYDIKFPKVWYESCDEAERAIIGQSAFAAYKSTNMTCVILWLVLICANMLFDFGLIPITVVAVIWIVNSLSYFLKSQSLEKKNKGPNGVSLF